VITKTVPVHLIVCSLLTLSAWGADNLTIANGGTDPVSSATFSVSGDKTVAPSTVASALASGNVDLQANADTVFSNSVSASSTTGNLVLQSGRSITLAASVGLSLGGSFTATAGDSGANNPPAGTPAFIMDSGSFVNAPAGITINNSGGGISLAQLTTNNNISLNAGGSVTQSNQLTGSGLELLGSGSYTLTNSSNHVSTLAANTTGAINYVDSGGINIGTVNGTRGLSADSVNVQTGGNISVVGPVTSLHNATLGSNDTIVLAQNVTIETPSNFLILSAGTEVAQSAGVITAGGLELSGGSFSLTSSGNAVGTLAAYTTGDVSFTNAQSLTIGTVNGLNGITTHGNVSLAVNGRITISGAINANNVSLQATGVTLSTAYHINASSISFANNTNLSLAVSAPVSSAILNGSVTFGQGTAFTLTTTNGYDPVAGDTFQLVSGSITGTPSWMLPALDPGLSWDTSQFTTTGAIDVVPEPSTISMLLLGCGLVLGRLICRKVEGGTAFEASGRKKP